MQNIMREPKWSTSSPSVIVLESEDGNRDIASEESKAKAKNLTDTRTTLRSLSETLQTTALLYLVPSTYMLHVLPVTTDIYLHISGYSSARGILCACVFLVVIACFLLFPTCCTVNCCVHSYSVCKLVFHA